MKHNNVAIFIPHNGCPHQCSFCSQRNITGQASQPTPQDVKNTLDRALENLGNASENSEIAFFGGSFTAIDKGYMISLLDETRPYIHKFAGIRISTRPDYIDEQVLTLLKSYGVTTIELGAQSMDDEVLDKNNRGHSALDVTCASRLIKEQGFKLGLQMMTGLYGSTVKKDSLTAEEFIKLRPDCVRIYPTVVIDNTALGDLYKSGEYTPYTLSLSVDLCSELMLNFYRNNIDVIRVGLHYSPSLAQGDLAGNYHPAFKELCENKIFLDAILEKIKTANSKDIDIFVNPKSLSKAIGQNKRNVISLEKLGYRTAFFTDADLNKYDIVVKQSVLS